MSQDKNIEVVRMWFAAVAQGDLAPELWHLDLVVDNTANFPVTGPYHGHEGLQRWWDDLSEVVDGATMELDEVKALDETRVLTVQRLVGAFSNTEIVVNEAWVAVFVLEADRIQRVSGYRSHAEALEAVGLAE